MSTWNKIQQVCATCRYWQGAREIDVWSINYTAKQDMGNCGNKDGCFRHTPMSEGSYCSEWESYSN